jgi:hypothetical protein
VRVAFPVLFKGEQFNGEGKFRCGASLLLPPDHPQLQAGRRCDRRGREGQVEGQGRGEPEGGAPQGQGVLRDGDTKPKYDGFPGNFYLSANCKGGDTEPSAPSPR